MPHHAPYHLVQITDRNIIISLSFQDSSRFLKVPTYAEAIQRHHKSKDNMMRDIHDSRPAWGGTLF